MSRSTELIIISWHISKATKPTLSRGNAGVAKQKTTFKDEV
jgi:hypothetical protein